MNPRVSLSGLDAAFLSLETASTPMNVMGTFVLDASNNASGGYSYARVLSMLEARLPDLAPFRRRLIAMPFGFDFPVWIDDPDLSYMDSLDFGIIACERSVPHVADIARGLGAAVAALFKIALDERLETSPLGAVGATPDPGSPLVMSN